jgi:hypothetical protein
VAGGGEDGAVVSWRQALLNHPWASALLDLISLGRENPHCMAPLGILPIKTAPG